MNAAVLAERLVSGSLSGVPALGVAFLGGLLAGLGPCVLPMLPAVFGYVTGSVADPGRADRRWSTLARALGLSAVFVLGMSLVFSAIGAAAGLLGRAVLAGAWARYAAAAVCVLIGLQMLGLIDLPLDRLNRWSPTHHPGRGGLWGALLFGMVFGAVASPCSTPILAAIATIAAATGSAAEGAVLLFVYGLGKGVPLMLLGLASGSIALMRSVSRATPVLLRLAGVAMLGAAACLVYLA